MQKSVDAEPSVGELESNLGAWSAAEQPAPEPGLPAAELFVGVSFAEAIPAEAIPAGVFAVPPWQPPAVQERRILP